MMTDRDEERLATKLIEGGRRKEWTQGLVSPAVWRASTILFDDVAGLRAAVGRADAVLYYGRRGSPTQWSLADALTGLEPGAAGTTLHASGTAAITTALLTVLAPGDELLMTDSTYEPTRAFCDTILRRIGVTSRYYDPCVRGADIDALFGPNTRAIFMESPGSLTFEIQDVPAICAARTCIAAKYGAWSCCWAKPTITCCASGWTPLAGPCAGSLEG